MHRKLAYLLRLKQLLIPDVFPYCNRTYTGNTVALNITEMFHFLREHRNRRSLCPKRSGIDVQRPVADKHQYQKQGRK